MKTKRSFWARLWNKPPVETKFIGTAEATYSNRLVGEFTKEMAIYKDFNPETGEIYSIYAKGGGYKVKINKDLYLHNGSIIEE